MAKKVAWHCLEIRCFSMSLSIEHAPMHKETAHNVLEVSPDQEEKIKANIRPVSVDGHQF
jgi:hypothetical protein